MRGVWLRELSLMCCVACTRAAARALRLTTAGACVTDMQHRILWCYVTQVSRTRSTASASRPAPVSRTRSTASCVPLRVGVWLRCVGLEPRATIGFVGKGVGRWGSFLRFVIFTHPNAPSNGAWL
jgi:hypothetical protein